MKNLNKIILSILITTSILLISSCNKDEIEITPVADAVGNGNSGSNTGSNYRW